MKRAMLIKVAKLLLVCLMCIGLVTAIVLLFNL